MFSQDNLKNEIDSLLKVPEHNFKSKIEKADFIFKTIFYSGRENRIKWYHYVLEKDSSDISKMVFYNYLGHELDFKGNLSQAKKVELAGLDISEKLGKKKYSFRYLKTIAQLLMQEGKLDSALIYVTQADRIANEYEINDFLWQLSFLKHDLEDLKGNKIKAELYLVESLKDLKECSSCGWFQKSYVLFSLIEHFTDENNLSERAKYLEIYFQERPENYRSRQADDHSPVLEMVRGEEKKQTENLKKSILISDSLKLWGTHYELSVDLARILKKDNKTSQAIEVLLATRRNLGEQYKNFLMVVDKILSQYYYEQGYFKKAFDYKVSEFVVRDSLTSERMLKNISKLEIKYETEKKDREIAQQSLEIEKKENQKAQLIGGLIGLGAILLLTGFFFWKRLQYQKTIAAQTQELQSQKITELQQQNKLLALNSMIEGQETERMRIAKDLHDSLGGLLSTVKAHFTTIQNEIKQLEKLNITEKTNELIDEACVEVRRISHNMIPHTLTISGLPLAIEDMVESLLAEGFEVELNIQNFPVDMPMTKQAMLYRLVQEIISNIRKHANAKEILIQILGDAENLSLIVEDNGDGFDYERATESGGVGLRSINSRVEFLNGTIDWDTNRGSGTTITVNIPII